jgi:hypothetical protein
MTPAVLGSASSHGAAPMPLGWPEWWMVYDDPESSVPFTGALPSTFPGIEEATEGVSERPPTRATFARGTGSSIP